MSDEVNKSEILTFVRKKLKNSIRLDGEYYIEHVIRRAKLAEQLALKHWNCVDLVDKTKVSWLEESWVYGMLFDIFSISTAKLEEVICVTSVELADTISKLSSDNRLPVTKREKKVLGELFDVRETAYYAFLADISESLKNYKKTFAMVPELASDYAVKQELQSFKTLFVYMKKKLTHVLCLSNWFRHLELELLEALNK